MTRNQWRLFQRAVVFVMAVLNTALFALCIVGAIVFASMGDGVPHPASWLGFASIIVIAAPIFWGFPIFLYATWLLGRRDMWLSRPSSHPTAMLGMRIWHVLTLYAPLAFVAFILLRPEAFSDSEFAGDLATYIVGASYALQLPVFTAWSAIWIWQKFAEELYDDPLQSEPKAAN